MLNGWGGYILTQADYLNAFFSHDEYIDFFAAERGLEVEDIRKDFRDGRTSPQRCVTLKTGTDGTVCSFSRGCLPGVK